MFRYSFVVSRVVKISSVDRMKLIVVLFVLTIVTSCSAFLDFLKKPKPKKIILLPAPPPVVYWEPPPRPKVIYIPAPVSFL